MTLGKNCAFGTILPWSQQNVVLVACFMPFLTARRKPYFVGGFAVTLWKKSAGFLELKRFFALAQNDEMMRFSRRFAPQNDRKSLRMTEDKAQKDGVCLYSKFKAVKYLL